MEILGISIREYIKTGRWGQIGLCDGKYSIKWQKLARCFCLTLVGLGEYKSLEKSRVEIRVWPRGVFLVHEDIFKESCDLFSGLCIFGR